MGDYYGHEVRAMDLRNVKENAYEARAKIAQQRRTAVNALTSTSPVRDGSQSARHTIRPSTAGRGANSATQQLDEQTQRQAALLTELTSRVASLERSLETLARDFAQQGSTASSKETFYSVAFGPGAIGTSTCAKRCTSSIPTHSAVPPCRTRVPA